MSHHGYNCLERQSEWALALTRWARDAEPEAARRLGEIAADTLHQVVAQNRKKLYARWGIPPR